MKNSFFLILLLYFSCKNSSEQNTEETKKTDTILPVPEDIKQTAKTIDNQTETEENKTLQKKVLVISVKEELIMLNH